MPQFHIEGLTKGAWQKSDSPNETDLLNNYLVNLSHLVNQKTFMGHLLWILLQFTSNFQGLTAPWKVQSLKVSAKLVKNCGFSFEYIGLKVEFVISLPRSVFEVGRYLPWILKIKFGKIWQEYVILIGHWSIWPF